MKNKMSKFLSVTLAFLMIISIIPITASAETISGTIGGNNTWTLDDETGVLTISGAGSMPNYSVLDSGTKSPWYSSKDVIKSVVIESGILSIGDAAFYDCTNLKSVSIPDSVTSIGENAFKECSSLTSITIPYGVEKIEPSTFSGCTSLTEVSLPESITSIENSAFRSCKSLVEIELSNSLESIVAFAFWGCNGLTNVVIPDSVTFLGDYVFRNCENLKTVTIPVSVEEVANSTFSGCTSLTDIYYGGTMEQWYEISNVARENVTVHCEGIDHTHEFTEWTVIEEPECDYMGFEYRKCETCTLEEERGIPATGHDYITNVTPPTCTSQGETKYTCSKCGDSYTDDYINSLGHNYDEGVVIASTCTGRGSTKYTCLTCGYFYHTDYVDALGHKYEQVVTEPTCTEGGYTTNTCTVCGNKTIGNRTEKTGHNIDSWELVSAPNCTKYGTEKGFCSNCNQYVMRTIEKLGHDYGQLMLEYEATCTTDGRKSKQCSRCGNKTSIEIIPATGHDYGEWEQIDDAKCGEYGKFESICSTCGNVNTMSAPAEHNYSSEITTPATHLTDGVKTFTCICGDTYTEIIEKIVEHNYEAIVTAPTCTEKGYTTYNCECGDNYIDNYVNVAEHIPADVVEENYVASTCIVTGSKEVVVYCSICETEISRETVTIETVEHTLNEYEQVLVEPTCTENGSKDVISCCAECNTVISKENITIDATGHEDNDGDGYCDVDDELLDPTVECNCNCHKKGISKFFFKFILFFQRIFGVNKVCECGVAHY